MLKELAKWRSGTRIPIIFGFAVVWVLLAILVSSDRLLMDLLGHVGPDSGLSLLPEDRVAGAAMKLKALVIGLVAFPFFVILELLWPTEKYEQTQLASVATDCSWYLLYPIILMVFVQPVEILMDAATWSRMPDQPLKIMAGSPLFLQMLVVILLADFLRWLNHLILHKVPLFWEFHKIHHSQRRLNPFTPFRVHPGERIAIVLLAFLPFSLLDLSLGAPAFVIWTFFLKLYEMFYHSNIRTNLGILRYVVVTPQSHRVHHSIEKEHVDRNFGNFLSVWDWIFRTQCRDCDVYPATGVSLSNYPNGSPSRIWDVPKQLLREFLYPFIAILKGFFKPSQRVPGKG